MKSEASATLQPIDKMVHGFEAVDLEGVLTVSAIVMPLAQVSAQYTPDVRLTR
jgi:hypothetical protein